MTCVLGISSERILMNAEKIYSGLKGKEKKKVDRDCCDTSQ